MTDSGQQKVSPEVATKVDNVGRGKAIPETAKGNLATERDADPELPNDSSFGQTNVGHTVSGRTTITEKSLDLESQHDKSLESLSIQESVWECCVLIGLRFVGKPGNAALM